MPERGPRAARTRSSRNPARTSPPDGWPSWSPSATATPAAPSTWPPPPVGELDRDGAVDRVLARLAAGRSAWNAADVRGELAEDLTARTLQRCVPLLVDDGTAVPEHLRA